MAHAGGRPSSNLGEKIFFLGPLQKDRAIMSLRCMQIVLYDEERRSKAASGRGGGAHSAPFYLVISLKRRVRTAHGCVVRSKPH